MCSQCECFGGVLNMLERVTNAESRTTFAEGMFGAERDQICPQKFSHAHIADRHLWFSIMCKALWNDAAPAALYDLVGQHLGYEDPDLAMRQCRRWAHGHSEPAQSITWMLIASKEGWRVVNYIGGDATWMVGLRRERELAVIARQIFGQLREVMQE
jgi:hypothetical protein